MYKIFNTNSRGDNIKKITAVLALILVICFISGGYALYLNEVNTISDLDDATQSD